MRLCHTRDLEGCRLGRGATKGSPRGTPYLQPADLGPAGRNQVQAAVQGVLTPRRGCASRDGAEGDGDHGDGSTWLC